MAKIHGKIDRCYNRSCRRHKHLIYYERRYKHLIYYERYMYGRSYIVALCKRCNECNAQKFKSWGNRISKEKAYEIFAESILEE